MTQLTAITYNLRDGGGDDRRLARQLDLLARLNPSVLALQECKWWDRNGCRLLHRAERVLRMRGFLAQSNHHGCHIGLFVRESACTRVTGWYPDRAAPYWHALARLVTEVDGYRRPLHIVGAHLAPSSPAIRLAEAETFSLLTGPGHDVIALGDFNAIPATGPDPELGGVPRIKARRKLDRRPAQAIEDAGFTDAGTQAGNRAPTVGFTGPDRLAYACGRIYTTLPPQAVAGYQVVGADEPGTGPAGAITGQALAAVRELSDHLPAAAVFTLGSDPTAAPAAPPWHPGSRRTTPQHVCGQAVKRNRKDFFPGRNPQEGSDARLIRRRRESRHPELVSSRKGNRRPWWCRVCGSAVVSRWCRCWRR